MNARLLRITGLALFAGAAMQVPVIAAAQSYPVRPVRIVAGLPAGTGVDFTARAVAGKLSEAFGQTFVVENRPGAGGNIAYDAVAKAAPDGYTILIANNSLAINPALYSQLTYDAVRDFAPISVTGTSPQLLVSSPTFSAKSLGELLDLARRKPGQINLASAGIGSPSHMAGALMVSMAGVNLVHVPYKGAPRAVADVLAGRVSLYISGLPPVVPLVREGRLRAIAVTTAKRSSALPEVPTFAESGLAGYDVPLWYGFLAPAKTPADIVRRLNAEMVRAMNSPELKARFLAQGVEPTTSSPEEFAARIRTGIQRWREVVKAANIKVE